MLHEPAGIAISPGTLQHTVAVATYPPGRPDSSNPRRTPQSPGRPSRRDRPVHGQRTALAARARHRKANNFIFPNPKRACNNDLSYRTGCGLDPGSLALPIIPLAYPRNLHKGFTSCRLRGKGVVSPINTWRVPYPFPFLMRLHVSINVPEINQIFPFYMGLFNKHQTLQSACYVTASS